MSGGFFMMLRRFTMPKSTLTKTASLAVAAVGFAASASPAFAAEGIPAPPATAPDAQHAQILRSGTSFRPVVDTGHVAATGGAEKADAPSGSRGNLSLIHI